MTISQNDSIRDLCKQIKKDSRRLIRGDRRTDAISTMLFAEMISLLCLDQSPEKEIFEPMRNSVVDGIDHLLTARQSNIQDEPPLGVMATKNFLTEIYAFYKDNTKDPLAKDPGTGTPLDHAITMAISHAQGETLKHSRSIEECVLEEQHNTQDGKLLCFDANSYRYFNTMREARENLATSILLGMGTRLTSANLTEHNDGTDMLRPLAFMTPNADGNIDLMAELQKISMDLKKGTLPGHDLGASRSA